MGQVPDERGFGREVALGQVHFRESSSSLLSTRMLLRICQTFVTQECHAQARFQMNVGLGGWPWDRPGFSSLLLLGCLLRICQTFVALHSLS